MDISNKQCRKRQLLDILDSCDSAKSRENILIDKILSLENTIVELQDSYSELLILYNKCAQVRF